MGHAESPSLISLGLAADVSPDASSFRWGMVTSCFLHVLFIVMAVFLRFHSPIEEPFRAIDVALISLTDTSAAVKTAPPATSAPKTKSMKSHPVKPQPAEVEPVEMLPPLPTQTASERLSEFLGGAIGSIVVPDRQMSSPAVPSPTAEPSPLQNQSPLIENLHLPSSIPQLSRPERLNPTAPLTIPKPDSATPRKNTDSMVPTPEPQEEVTLSQPAPRKPAMRLTPALPEFSQVAPFRKTEREVKPDDLSTSKNLEESFKRTLPTLPTPTPPAKIQRKPNALPPQPQKSAVPQMSAPQLAQIRPPASMEKGPRRERMSDMMEQLLGEVKVPNLQTSSAPVVPQPPEPSLSPSSKPVPSEMDQRIAKLSIPSITPVESIKKRLQLLEVQSASDSGNSSSQPSVGTNQYLGLIQDLIQDQWRKTPLVAKAPLVVLKFRISRTGEISQIQIDESSGNEYYDSAARRAVHAVNPLPSFPPEISESSLPVRFHFIKTDNKT